MNTITLYIDVYKGCDNPLIKSGISFSDVQIIKLLIDGEDILESKDFKDTFIYFKELSVSYIKSGKYLLFTPTSGISLEGGWERVEVAVDTSTVKWVFEFENNIYAYKFKKSEYISEIKSVENYLKINKSLDLEPVNVMYPEDCL